jgi:hypothetical protein
MKQSHLSVSGQKACAICELTAQSPHGDNKTVAFRMAFHFSDHPFVVEGIAR